MLTFSFITTLSLKFWPKTKPDEDVVVAGCTGAGTDVLLLGATLLEPSGTNFGGSGSFVSLSLLSTPSVPFSFSALASSASEILRKGLFPGFNCGGRNTDPAKVIKKISISYKNYKKYIMDFKMFHQLCISEFSN